tara:strand:- start:33 stop:407 length:375 start_codon:yes stop_codon:yes gene_type:complete
MDEFIIKPSTEEQLGVAAAIIETGGIIIKLSFHEDSGKYQYCCNLQEEGVPETVIRDLNEWVLRLTKEEVWQDMETRFQMEVPSDVRLKVMDTIEDAIVVEKEGPVAAMHAIAKRAELRAKEAG